MQIRHFGAKGWSTILLAALFLFVIGGAALAEGGTESQAIAERLSGAMRFETVSYENSADFDGAPFDALENYLRAQYPRTHARSISKR